MTSCLWKNSSPNCKSLITDAPPSILLMVLLPMWLLLLFPKELVKINQYPRLSTVWIPDLYSTGVSPERTYSQFVNLMKTLYQFSYLQQAVLSQLMLLANVKCKVVDDLGESREYQLSNINVFEIQCIYSHCIVWFCFFIFLFCCNSISVKVISVQETE